MGTDRRPTDRQSGVTGATAAEVARRAQRLRTAIERVRTEDAELLERLGR